MLTNWTILAASLIYIGVLFAIASWGDRTAQRYGSRIRAKPVIYALSLAVYCTSWTFYGSVGLASSSGYDFIPVYLGPILLFTAGYFVLRKIVRIGKAENITTIADFIAARFGKSQVLAAVVTLIVVIGILPYIALQLKAVSTSFNVLVSYPEIIMPAGGTAWWADTALVVALLMAVFSIMFGTRNIDATEHHQGMMLAIAFESIVKLVAFLAAGIFVTFYMFEGFGDLAARAGAVDRIADRFAVDIHVSKWVTITLLSLMAIICLPRQFHVAVVENADEGELKTAAWLFPTYLVLINIFVIPIALAGLLMFDGRGAGVDADTFVLTLPMLAQQETLTLFVFIGGLSAATGMVIVATVALATMISNDVFTPLYLRYWYGDARSDADVGATLLNVRRIAMTAILLLAFAYYRVAGDGQALASIGLISFAGVAQFAPAIFGGIFWARATRVG
ncbi:MAG: sodium:solute symporter, partial [Rhodospirillaceae bacterium]|nr:sodium:solute symporter [Rhodospirillaceae bacterium]